MAAPLSRAAGVGAAAAAAVALLQRREHRGSAVARLDGGGSGAGSPGPAHALHVWGPAQRDRAAALWDRFLAESDECPRAVAWGAGAGVAATPAGDLVAVHPQQGVVATRAGARAGQVAMDGSNAVFYATADGRLRRWDAFGARGAETELLPGRVVTSVACGTSHCLAIDDGGTAYSWASQHGGARMGVLGRACSGQAASEDEPAPVVLPGGARAAQCACGDAHRSSPLAARGCATVPPVACE